MYHITNSNSLAIKDAVVEIEKMDVDVIIKQSQLLEKSNVNGGNDDCVSKRVDDTISSPSGTKIRKPLLVKNTFSGGVRYFAPTENALPLSDNDEISPFEPDKPRFQTNRNGGRRLFLADDNGERPFLLFGDIEDKISELQLNPEPTDVRYAIEMRNKLDRAFFKRIANDPTFAPSLSSTTTRRADNNVDIFIRLDDPNYIDEPVYEEETLTTGKKPQRNVDRFTAKDAFFKKMGITAPKTQTQTPPQRKPQVSVQAPGSASPAITRPTLQSSNDNFEPKKLMPDEQLKIDSGSIIADQYARGTRVLAMWVDKHLYTGVIVRNDSYAGYKIRFSDGEFRDMSEAEFIPLFKLKQGDELAISVTSRRDVYQFIPCKITKCPSKKDVKEWHAGVFEVENKASGKVENVPWEKLAIESKQIKNYLTNKRPTTTMANSLEASIGAEPGATRRSLRPKRPKLSIGAFDSGPEEELVQLDYPAEEPVDEEYLPGEDFQGYTVATGIRTPKETKKTKKSAGDSAGTKGPAPRPTTIPKRQNIPPHQILRTQAPPQQPPSLSAEGKLPQDGAKREAMLVIKPYQQVNRTMFQGLRFVLTSATRPKDFLNVNDEGMAPAMMPFVKRQVRQMIEERGGHVIDDFSQIPNAGPNCYLVADQFYRTHKYLSALVRAVPCVSHMWVFECCKENQFLPPTIFMLPAGRSLESGQIVKWHNRCPNLLQGFTVYLYTDNKPDNPNTLNFVQIWTPIAKMMGAVIADKLPDINESQARKIDIVLTDASIPESIVQKAIGLGAQAVSSEWLIQGIIIGQLPPITAHPKYKYNFAEGITAAGQSLASVGQDSLKMSTNHSSVSAKAGHPVFDSDDAPPTLAAQSSLPVDSNVEQQFYTTADPTEHLLTSDPDNGQLLATDGSEAVIDISNMTAEELQALGIQLVEAGDLGQVLGAQQEVTTGSMSTTDQGDGQGGDAANNNIIMISPEDLEALSREGVQIFNQDGMFIIQQADGTTTVVEATDPNAPTTAQ